MKTRSLSDLGLVLVLTTVPLAGGCTQSVATNVEPAITNAPATSAPSGGETAPSEPLVSATAVATESRVGPAMPPSILPATPLAEVVKLAQSGVDDTVMLSFITNSSKPFNLGAEEIVYLNDLGVTGHIITTMMQHDQELHALPTKPAPTVVSETAPVAAAPSYVNPPAAEPVTEPQPTYVSNNYFYDSLAPYGSWIEIEGYGRCWRPTVVVANRNWQPYCDRGRWVYTDAGWYWLSDYTWGATTFHYGRWFAHPSWGWCWWPDTVWAPSWVNWRYSSSYCGWAPLPPGACYQAGFGFSYYGSSAGFGFGFGLGVSAYTFVPWGGFCAARPYQYRVPVHQAGQIYNNSTVVNNYVSGNNNTVINNGISPDKVRQYTGTEVRTAKIREQAVSGQRRERLERDGRSIMVSRPVLSPREVGRNTLDRSSPRTVVSGVNGTSVSRPLQTSSQPANGRRGSESGGSELNRPAGNSATLRSAPDVVARTPSPARGPIRPSSESQQNNAGAATVQGRVNSPLVVSPSTASTPSAATPPSTVRVYHPRSVPDSAQNSWRPASTAPAGSLIIIADRNATRTGGRDYSVWSTPSPAPVSVAPVNSGRENGSAPAGYTPRASVPRVRDSAASSAARPWKDGDVASRDSYPTSSSPETRTANVNPRGESADFTPGVSQPTATWGRPATNQRFESRSGSVPGGSTAAPARPQPGSGWPPGQRGR